MSGTPIPVADRAHDLVTSVEAYLALIDDAQPNGHAIVSRRGALNSALSRCKAALRLTPSPPANDLHNSTTA